MPTPSLSAGQREKFEASSMRYAEAVIRNADVNHNGNLTRKEARALGDINDTFKLYAHKGKTVDTEKFLRFYKDYVHVAVKSTEMPTDLQDNVANWVRLQAPAPDVELLAVAAQQGEDLTRFIINWRSDVADYYEYGDDDYIVRDAAALRTYFAGAEWEQVDTPQGNSAYRAYKAVNSDPEGVLEGGEVIVLLDMQGNVENLLYRNGDDDRYYSVDDVGTPIDLDAVESGQLGLAREAAYAISSYFNENNVRSQFPDYWDNAFGTIEANSDGSLTVVYDYEFFAGSNRTEDEHVAEMAAWMQNFLQATPELQQYADVPIGFFGPWGT